MRKLLRTISLAAFLAAPFALSSFMGFTGPAGAGLDVTVSFVHPGLQDNPRDFTPAPGSVVAGTWKMVADASASSYLKTFRVEIRPDDSGHTLPDQAVVIRSYSPGDRVSADRLQMIWDSGAVTRFNGGYHLVATATSQLGNVETATVADLKVNNPPLAPASVQAAVTQGTVMVTWKNNSEPDITGYRVLRSVDTEPFTQAGLVTAASFKDDRAPARAGIRYKVIALRYSPVSPEGIASYASAETSRVVIIPPGDPSTNSVIEQGSEPAPAASAAPRVIVGARRDVGYSPFLPYAGGSPANGQTQKESPAALSRTIRSVIDSTVYRPPYIAAALILLVLALQVLRIAGRLFTTA